MKPATVKRWPYSIGFRRAPKVETLAMKAARIKAVSRG